jgi:uncharacterized MAPEG superfamily protein
MSVELTMLAYAVGLLVALVVIQAFAGIRSVGLMPLANNRDGLDPAKGFHARMLRVVDNHREGLVMFAPLALAAAVMHLSTPMTVLAAQLFFWARLVHAILYILGVPMVRPLAWGVGLAGTIMILLAILHLI